MKKKLNQGFFNKLFGSIFGTMGIQKKIVKNIIRDPYVKKQMKNVQKGLNNIKKYADYLQQLNDSDKDNY